MGRGRFCQKVPYAGHRGTNTSQALVVGLLQVLINYIKGFLGDVFVLSTKELAVRVANVPTLRHCVARYSPMPEKHVIFSFHHVWIHGHAHKYIHGVAAPGMRVAPPPPHPISPSCK